MTCYIYKRRQKKRRLPINANRKNQGDCYNLVLEVRLDSEKFYNSFRMNVEALDNLLKKLDLLLKKMIIFEKQFLLEGMPLFINKYKPTYICFWLLYYKNILFTGP